MSFCVHLNVLYVRTAFLNICLMHVLFDARSEPLNFF
jgi:hypothetical protein